MYHSRTFSRSGGYKEIPIDETVLDGRTLCCARFQVAMRLQIDLQFPFHGPGNSMEPCLML